MRILDLDLDFFLNEVPYHADMYGSKRLSSNVYKPWEIDRVKKFLEENCGLSISHPVKGEVIETHDEAFYVWRKLIASNFLEPPFDVVHVDSHVDLGSGDGSFIYIMTELLHQPQSNRKKPKKGFSGINPGSYLAFAIAVQWIRSLVYVTHPNAIDDVMFWHLKDLNPKAEYIQLKKCDPALFDSSMRTMDSIGVLSTEPLVPFRKSIWSDYKNQAKFDFAIFCTSPTFTPIESDMLIPIINQYIEQIEY